MGMSGLKIKKKYVLLRLNQALVGFNFEPIIAPVNRKIGTSSPIRLLAKPCGSHDEPSAALSDE